MPGLTSAMICSFPAAGSNKTMTINKYYWAASPSSCRTTRVRVSATATAFVAVSDDEKQQQHRRAVEVLRGMAEDGWVDQHLLPLLSPVEDAWQPADLLPSFGPAAAEELQVRAAGVPDDILVFLVGNMVTEEALPTYMSMGNRVDGGRDATGCDDHAWARWLRGWTAEENRRAPAQKDGASK